MSSDAATGRVPGRARVGAAKLLVKLDKRAGRTTPEQVLKLAGVAPASVEQRKPRD